MSEQEKKIDSINKELEEYGSSNKRFTLRQAILLTSRPHAEEYEAFDIVLSKEAGVYYLNIHDGSKFVRFKEA